MSRLLNRLVELEADIAYALPPEDGDVEYRYQPGSVPLLLSAPHGAVHTRKGAPKDEDEYTAAIARLVAEETRAHVMYAHRKSGTDPNYDPGVPYKLTMQQIVETARIAFVMDIHGSSPAHPFGLALGTIAGASCPDYRNLILESLRQSGFSENFPGLDRLDIDQTFPAAGGVKRETVTRYAWQKLGVQAAQIEIHSDMRIVRRKPDASAQEPFEGDPEQIMKTVRALIHIVQAIAER